MIKMFLQPLPELRVAAADQIDNLSLSEAQPSEDHSQGAGTHSAGTGHYALQSAQNLSK